MTLNLVGKSALLLHCGFFCLCIYFYFVQTEVDQLLTDKGLSKPVFGRKSRYLTVWGQYLALFYVFACCINDLTHILDLRYKNTTMKVIQYIFHPICTITSIIGIVFWGIFLLDPDALDGKGKLEYYPTSLMVFSHGGSALMLWTDTVLCVKKIYQKQFHYFSVIGILLIYLMWSQFCATLNGSHAYPFLDKLDFIQYIVFILTIVVISSCTQYCTFIIVEKLHVKNDNKTE